MELERQAKVFKALGNPQRLRLYHLLCEWQGPDCCVEVSDDRLGALEGVDRSFTRACCTMSLSRSTISHHFKELEAAGLITCTRQGNHQVCTVEPRWAAVVQGVPG